MELVEESSSSPSLPTSSLSELKECIDCSFPFPLAAFYTSTSSKDGRQSRCKGCDRRRRAEHNRGLHVKASDQIDFEREESRKRAMEVVALSKPVIEGAEGVEVRPYEGVKGGYLIYGYVR